MAKMFDRILIANRGEIAVRIIRACREMGITPVTVFSDVDSKALHVQMAEEAYHIGDAKPSESYLNIDKLIEVSKASKVQALHPGYGFLAENPKLVRRCEEEGIVFIGPPSKAMELMGKKTASRQKMVEAGVPIIPGTLQSLRDEDDLEEQADKIGYPVLLKASAGGGGKGLRLVTKKEDLRPSFRMAQSEAQSSFDDSSVYLEKYIDEPHHIEIQILADNYGHFVYLGERECSIQRRYQKVLEETPSPLLDDKTRCQMGQIAVKAAAAVDYRNAGTVEFVVDRNKNFYFLEMNTRLQVEHPITEMVTGVDLVKSQIEIAAGLPLSLDQADIQSNGFALECRIYAEDPDNDFIPSPGKIAYLRAPSGGLGIRDDNGVYEGYEVPLEYDPLISKLITWGKTRPEAIQRMLRALSEYHICGIKTTIPFFRRILLHPKFVAGEYDTHFISNLKEEEDGGRSDERNVALIAAGIRSYMDKRKGPAGLHGGRKRWEGSWKFQGRLDHFHNRL